MTTPSHLDQSSAPAPRASWRTRTLRAWLRPAPALILFAVAIAIAALFAPEATDGRFGDARLTTMSTSPLGARLLQEVAQRLGWSTDRWVAGGHIPLDSNTVLLVLAPPEPPSALETHRVLDGVRRGGALIAVVQRNTPLSDSLGVTTPPFGGARVASVSASGIDTVTFDSTANASPASDTADADGFAADSVDESEPRDSATDVDTATDADSAVARSTDADSADAADSAGSERDDECGAHARRGGAAPLWSGDDMILQHLQFKRGRRPRMLVEFGQIAVAGAGRRQPTAVGFPLGRGRVVAISDPDLLRNDVLRVCRWGADVMAVRMLEYAGDGGSTPRHHLVFDEYHQGYGDHPGSVSAIARYLVRARSGRVLLQAVAAGLLLLLALGPRTVAPRDDTRVERRSPFEHVTALAAAYGSVRATRTVVTRLLRGVRRRTERPHAAAGSQIAADDAAFLDHVARRDPGLAGDVDLVRRALATPFTRAELAAAADALARIEHSLMTLRGAL